MTDSTSDPTPDPTPEDIRTMSRADYARYKQMMLAAASKLEFDHEIASANAQIAKRMAGGNRIDWAQAAKDGRVRGR